MISLWRAALPIAPLLIALAACGEDGGTEPPGPPAGLRAVFGDNQVGIVTQELPDPLRVRVTDSNGRALGGVEVEFEVTSGGGTISAEPIGEGPIAGLSASRTVGVGVGGGGGGGAGGAGGSSVSGVPIKTGFSGVGEATWRLGPRAGVQTATATVEGLTPSTFTATATPGAPGTFSETSGNNQLGPTGAALARPFVVTVLDNFGNGVPRAGVNWEVSSGGGRPSATSSKTDASGAASITFTLGDASGVNTVIATLADTAVQGGPTDLNPVTFTAVGLRAITDPTGDNFPTSASAGLVAPDIVSLGAAVDGESNLVVRIEFADEVASDATGGPNVVIGFLDIDTDQDPGTGIQPATEFFGPGAPGSTGMGTDFFVSYLTEGTGLMPVLDSESNVVATISPTFDGNKIDLFIPLSSLGGDEGDVNLATVVGTIPEPTDIAPNDGNLTAGPSATSGPRLSRSPASTAHGLRPWGWPGLKWKKPSNP